MDQKTINKYFNSDLGQQCSSLFSTPDDRVFIRYSEAQTHCEEKHMSLFGIKEWFEDEVVETTEPTSTQFHNALEAAIETLTQDHPEFMEEGTTGNDMINTLEYLKNKFNLSTLDTELPF